MRKLLVAVLVLALVFSFAACKNEAETTEVEQPEGPVTLTVWAWDPNFNIAIMELAGEMYEGDVVLEVVDYAKGDLEQKLHTMLASGTTDGLPDIVLIEDYLAQTYIQSYPGSFADLTDAVDHSQFGQYKVGLMTHEEKVYGIPFDSGVSGFLYRTDLLAAAGYEAADLENITWDEFIAIGEDMFEKTGQKLIATDPLDGGLLRVMLNGAGAWYFDDEGKPALEDNVALAEAMRVYAAIVNSPMTKHTSGWGEWVGAINSGDVASITTGCWIVGSVKAGEGQSGQWAVAPTPRLDLDGAVNASNLGGSSWYILDSSANKTTAVEFMNTMYAGDDAFYQQILMDNGAVGSYIPSATGEAYATADEFFAGQAIYSDLAKWAGEIPQINIGTDTYAADAVIMNLMPAVYEGGSIEEALVDAQAQLESQIQ